MHESGPVSSPTATDHPRPAPVRPGPAVLRCLLVEDSQFDRSLVRYSANRGGFDIEFVEVRTLARARECLEEEKFDLVILDSRLPDGDGLDLSTELAAGTRNIGVPVIMVGTDDGESGAALHGGGCIGFIAKNDLSPERLGAAIRNALVRDTAEPGEGAGDDLRLLLGALSEASRFNRMWPLCSRLMTVVSELRRSPLALSDAGTAAALEELSELSLMLWLDLDAACGSAHPASPPAAAPRTQKG